MELVSGNIFIRPNPMAKAGDVVEGHTHNFDHTTYVIRGSVRIEQVAEDGTVMRAAVKRASDGQNWVLIRAEVRHRIIALEDNSEFHCIYAHRNPQGDIVQRYEGWEDAYV